MTGDTTMFGTQITSAHSLKGSIGMVGRNTCAVTNSSVLSESSEIDVQAIIAHSPVTKSVGAFNKCLMFRPTNGPQISYLSVKNYPRLLTKFNNYHYGS